MSEIDIKQLLLLIMQNAGEFAKLNLNMGRVAQILEQVENNEIDLIGRNKGLYTSLREMLDTMKASTIKMDTTIADVFREMRDIATAVSRINFSGNGISKEAIEAIFQEQVDKRLIESKDEESKQKDKWIKILLVVAIALLAVILTMIGLDIAGVFDMVRGIA